MRLLVTMTLAIAAGCTGGDATSETPIADNRLLTALLRDASS